jgi:hypothetical protein
MDKYSINKNIEVVFLTAPTFPNDVPTTFEKLHSLIPDNPNRRYFGISHPDKTGKINYKAAAEILPSDTFDQPELQKFSIEKGEFVTKYIVNHFKDSSSIGTAFQELLAHPLLDPNGYCLEVYKNYTDVDVHCMVRILY